MDTITSKTQFIKMVASRSYDNPEKYNLILYVDGIHAEFPMSEGPDWHELSLAEAQTRIAEFEQTLQSEISTRLSARLTDLIVGKI